MITSDKSQKENDAIDTDLLTTLETLGNHLHAQITSYFPQLHEESVSKVTGVLLECGQHDILAMLQDSKLLQKRVEKVLPLIIPPPSSSSDNATEQTHSENTPDSSDSAILSDWTDLESEELFDKVAAIDPIFCAKITGMLLEKKPIFLKQCLTDVNLLNSAVEKARLTYLKSLEAPSVSSLLEIPVIEEKVPEKEEEVEDDNDDDDDDDDDDDSTGALNNHLNELGNVVFSQVVMWYPKLADKITGMLLEMNIEELESIIDDSDVLKSRADKAYLVLKQSGYLTSDDRIKEKISMSYR